MTTQKPRGSINLSHFAILRDQAHGMMGESEQPVPGKDSQASSKSPPMTPPKKRNTLLRPAIFEYSCNGYIHLEDRAQRSGGDPTTNRKDIENRESLQSSLPHCRGIQSKLRKVRDLPPSTRDASIMDFLQMVSLEAPHENHSEANKDKARNSGGEHGHMETGKNGSISGPPIGPASALPVLPGAADYGPPPDDLPDDPSRENVAKRKSGAVQILPNPDEEEGGENGGNGTADYYSTLSCWGMTNVSVLILTKPDGKRDVAAIAQENTLGITVRDEGDAKGGDATGTLRVGPIEVAITNKYEYETAALASKDQEDNAENSQRDDRTADNIDEEGEPSEPFADRLGRTLTKTAENMRDNAKTVADVEFPRRMLKSSERIANEFGSTLHRTGKVAKSMFRFWSDDDDDDNDGNTDY